MCAEADGHLSARLGRCRQTEEYAEVGRSATRPAAGNKGLGCREMGVRAAALLPCLVPLIAAAAADAAPRPPEPVRVVRLSIPPPTVLAGSVFRIWDVTRNVGTKRVRRTRTIYVAVRGHQLRTGAVV